MILRSLAAACAAFVLSSQASAVTVEYAVMSGSVDAGILIFAIGVVLLVVPKLAKLGVLYMLLADALFVGRILFFPQMQQWLNEHGYAEILATYDEPGLQKAGCIAICCSLIGLAVVAVFLYWLWRKFWHRFGFYRTRAEIVAAKKVSEAKGEVSNSEHLSEGLSAAESEDVSSTNDKKSLIEASDSELKDGIEPCDDMIQTIDADKVEAAINKNFGRTSEVTSSRNISDSSDESISVPKTIEEQMLDAADYLQVEKNANQTIAGVVGELPLNGRKENIFGADDTEPSLGRLTETGSFDREDPGIGDLGRRNA